MCISYPFLSVHFTLIILDCFDLDLDVGSLCIKLRKVERKIVCY